MNKETIRRIDAFVGSILCFVLTLHRRVSDWLGSRTQSPIRKVLFLKLIEQGATVLAAPAIRRAVERVGRENVYFLVFRENRPILDLLELVPAENVLEIRHASFLQFAGDALRSLRRIRREQVDTVIDMEFLARAPALLAYLSGASRRVGLHRFTSEGPYRGDLMTHRVQHNPYLHTSVAYHVLVEALDEDPTDVPLVKLRTKRALAVPRFTPSAEDLARVRSIVEERAGTVRPDQTMIVLNPNTGDLLPLRMWPAERFVELGKRILANIPRSIVVITGAPSEQEGAEAVCRDIGSERVISVAGATSLRDVLVLYAMADVLVTNDSGPGHFASLTDIDNIVLFGPETPRLFGPLGPHAHALTAELACSPCVNAFNHRFSPCKNNVCMQSISVEEVYREVVSAVAARRARNQPASIPDIAVLEAAS